MLFNFRDFCENAANTVYTPPTVNTGFSKGDKTFEQTIDPLIEAFVKKVLTDVMDKYNTQLTQPQIDYVLDKIKSKLTELKYDARTDLKDIISNMFKKGQLAHSTVKQS